MNELRNIKEELSKALCNELADTIEKFIANHPDASWGEVIDALTNIFSFYLCVTAGLEREKATKIAVVCIKHLLNGIERITVNPN